MFKRIRSLEYLPVKDRKDEPQRTRLMWMNVLQMKCGSPWSRTLTGRSVPLLPVRDSSAEPDAFLKP
ncbi:MAG: hypothetical protein C4K48_10685 [Candidatus Thorarchaeota archaeon]|nr:MAG: hypothetical protein C4K48_10685 [Candidatus Thorarchaeota archaeon]